MRKKINVKGEKPGEKGEKGKERITDRSYNIGSNGSNKTLRI